MKTSHRVLLDKLPEGTVVKNWKPFVLTLPPGPLTPEQMRIVSLLQRESLADGEAPPSLASEGGWMRASDSWVKASAWLGQQMDKAASLKDSIVSRIVGPDIPLPTLNARNISCFGKDLEGNHVQEPCEKLQRSANGSTHHCGACGCGDTFLTQLEPGLKLGKLLYPSLECPLKKRGFSNEFEDEDFDNRKRLCVWNPNTGGLGDCCASLWISQGYVDMGWDVWYLPSVFDQLIEACGFSVRMDRSQGAWNLGSALEAYREQELGVDKGKNPRLHVWSSEFPSSPIPRKPPLKIPEAAFARTSKFRQEIGGASPYVVLAPTTYYRSRRWPLDHWFKLAKLFMDAGVKVVALGGPDEETNLRRFPHYFTDLNFLESLALLKGAAHFVGNDSGPAWLRALGGGPGTVLMGPTKNIYTTAPGMRELRVSKERVGCVGCHFDAAAGFQMGCDYVCQALKSLTPAEVFDQIRRDNTSLP